MGGILLAIKSDIHEPITTPTQLEMTATKIHLNNNKHIIIAAIYQHPNSDPQYIDDMCNSIKDLSSKIRNYVLWVGGDLNLPDINWSDCTIQGHSYRIDINQHFLDMLLTTHAEQIITTPTRQNNILDIFITNRPSLTSQCHTIPGLGDHHALSIHSSAQAHRTKPARRKIHLWRHADIDNLKHARSQHHSPKHSPSIAPFTQCGTTSNPSLPTYKNSTSPANSPRHASTNRGSPLKSNA